MCAFLLPPFLLEEFQRLINSFWWGMNKEREVWYKLVEMGEDVYKKGIRRFRLS